MVLLAAIGGGSFVVVACVLGIRLLFLSYRTRELPEFSVGLALFLMGGMGYPLTVTARHATALSDPTRLALIFGNELFTLMGMTSLAFFTWRVFRPDSSAARVFVAMTAVVFAGFMASQGLSAGWLQFANDGSGPWNHSTFASSLVLGWAGWESLRYHMMLRKRQRIGLADPVVVDRFRLWAVGILAACLISLTSASLRQMGIEMRTSALGGLLIGSFGMVASSCIWLAFFPPSAYTRWVAAPNQRAEGA